MRCICEQPRFSANHERAYPAIAIEVQEALGIDGFGFDMNVACSSATFAMQTATDMIRAGSVDTVLIVNPEKGLNEMQWAGCGLVFVGIAVEVIEKYTGSSKKAAPAADVAAKKKTKKAE